MDEAPATPSRLDQMKRALVNADKAGDVDAARKLATAIKAERESAADSGPLTDFRKQYPQYDDMDDGALADALYRRFYSDMPRSEFDGRLYQSRIDGAFGSPSSTQVVRMP